MSDERIQKDLLYNELVVGRPKLRHKNVCKSDLKSLSVNIDEWKGLTKETNGVLVSATDCVKGKIILF